MGGKRTNLIRVNEKLHRILIGIKQKNGFKSTSQAGDFLADIYNSARKRKRIIENTRREFFLE